MKNIYTTDNRLPSYGQNFVYRSTINPIRSGLFFGCLGPGGGGGVKVPVAYNSKTIHGIETKFGRVIGNHKLTNLV